MTSLLLSLTSTFSCLKGRESNIRVKMTQHILDFTCDLFGDIDMKEFDIYLDNTKLQPNRSVSCKSGKKHRRLEQFDLTLRSKIRYGKYKQVKKMLESNFFKKKYTNGWKFKIDRGLSPIGEAVRSYSSKLIILLLKYRVNTQGEDLIGIVQNAMKTDILEYNRRKLLKKRAFKTVIRLIDDDTISFRERIIILYSILEAGWIVDFVKTMDKFEITPHIFFHTFNISHFPFFQLCENGYYATALHLLHMYSGDVLNISCHWADYYEELVKLEQNSSEAFMQDFNFSGVLFSETSDILLSGRDRKYLVCAEQELVFSLLDNSVACENKQNVVKEELIKYLFELDYFTDATLFCNYQNSIHPYGSLDCIVQLQNERNLLAQLVCNGTNDVKECKYKLFSLLERLNGKRYAVLAFLKESVSVSRIPIDKFFIYKMFTNEARIIKKEYGFLLSILEPLVSKVELFDCISYLYKEAHMDVNVMFNNSDMLFPTRSLFMELIRMYDWYEMFDSPLINNIYKVLHLMIAAGERDADMVEFNKICSYKGPGKQTFVDSSNTDLGVPLLIEMGRKTIRDQVYMCQRETNMFYAVSRLNLPKVIKEYLLYNEKL